MSGTELRDLFGQIISAEPEPPFTAADYVSAGRTAEIRRRHRRFAAGGLALVGMILAVSVAGPMLSEEQGGQQPASPAAKTPRISLVPGVYFVTGATETGQAGVGSQVLYSLRWRTSAPDGVCAVAGAVYNSDGRKLTSFEDRTGPFRRSMLYRDIVHPAYNTQAPPPYVKVTVTDCRGRTSTDAANIAVERQEETVATFSPGWTTQRCTCWSGGTVRRSAAAGQSASYTAAFNGVAVLTTTRPGGGSADVYVDGRYVRTINAAAGRATNRVVGFQTHFAGYGTHTIEVRVTKGSVDIDGFLTSHAPSGWGR